MGLEEEGGKQECSPPPDLHDCSQVRGKPEVSSSANWVSTGKRACIEWSGQRLGGGLMYGPPLLRKRNVRMSQVGLRKCIRPLLECITPGQDGMRCALFPIS